MHHFVAIGELKLELQSGNAQFGSNSTIFRAVRPWNLTDDLEKTIRYLFDATSSFVHHLVSICELKLELQSGNARFGSKWTIFLAVWPCNLTYDLQKNRAPLLCRVKLCASFNNHWWIQTGVTVRKLLIWVKFDDFFSRVTLKFDGWPWKTIGHLFYVASSLMHDFIAISEFKLRLQSGNAQFGSKSAIFLYRVTLKFYGWPWKTIGHLFYATSSFVHHFTAIGEFNMELQSGNAQFRSNSTIFLAMCPWNLTDDFEKQ